IRALAGKGFFQLTPGADPSLSLLRRLSASASFDTSRGQTETLTADQQQLSQWTARLQVIDQRDPYGPSAAARWRDRLVSIQTGIPEAAIKLFATFDTDPVVKMWLQATQDAVTAAKVAASAKSVTERAIDIATTLRDRESSFPTADQLRPETVLALDQYERRTSRWGQRTPSVPLCSPSRASTRANWKTASMTTGSCCRTRRERPPSVN